MLRVAFALVIIVTVTGCSGGDQASPVHTAVEVENAFTGRGLNMRKVWGAEGTTTLLAVESADSVDVHVFPTEEAARNVATALRESRGAPYELLLRSSNVLVTSEREVDDAVRDKLENAISQLNG